MENSNVTPLVPKEKNTKENSSLVSSLSPREIVSELDRFVVGQNKAKKAVAVATATAFFALFCPTTNLSNSDTISLGDNELTKELFSLVFFSFGTKGVTFEFSIIFLKP